MKYWAAFAIINLCIVVSMHFLQNKKINVTEKNIYLYYLFSVIFLIINYELSTPFLRIINNIISHIFLAKVLFNISLKEGVVLGLLVNLLNILLEVCLSIFLLPIVNLNLFSLSNVETVFYTNFLLGIFLCIFSKIIGKNDLYSKLLKKLYKINEYKIVFFSIIIVLLFNLFTFLSYFSSLELYMSPSFSLLGSVLGIFSSIMIFIFLKENNKYIEMSEKYNVSLNSIRGYENMIESNRVNNHEVRNQFLMLRGMSKNKKLNTYIDSILNKNISTNEDLLNKVIKIPSGGLRGLIYTKLIKMQDNNINYEVHVDKRVNSRKFSKIDSNTMVDICKIIGVFLDNAIECVSKLKKKNISIEFYVEKNDIIICITNNFEGKIDFDRLGIVGYTTKGKGRGYGLRLVKEILNTNNYLENTRELYNDNFTQNLKIKM